MSLATPPAPPPVSLENPNDRFHAFDALRAGMMLLGIVLHSSTGYLTLPIPLAPFSDLHKSPWCDLIGGFIHTFRMPVFFMMGGFFAALLQDRRGTKGMLHNRWRRLMLPLILGWFMLTPLLLLAIVFANMQHPHFHSGIPTHSSSVFHQHQEKDGMLLHLWFLYDLFLFCALAALVQRWPLLRTIRATTTRIFTMLCHSGWLPLSLSVLTAAALFPMQTGTFDTSAWIFPPGRILFAYGIFFTMGWLLYGHRSNLQHLERRAGLKLILGVLLFVPHAWGLATIIKTGPQSGTLSHWITALAGGFASTLLVLGITGMCLRVYRRSVHWIRYLTEASYFIYLIHLPVVLFLNGLFAPYPLSGFLKFACVTMLTSAICLALYQFGVRGTRVEEFLNGRKSIRSCPSHRTTGATPPIAPL